MKKILVVDDERDVEFLFNQRFRKEIRNGDLTIRFAFSADNALEILSNNNSEEIVLVLSDINMPGRSGIELLKELKTDFPDLKVFMVSAYNDSEYRTMAEESGADDFISKPVDFKELKERVRPVLET